MRLRRVAVMVSAMLAGTATLAAVGPVASAGAHPLGNFTINHYGGLHVSARLLRLDYVLDFAEIPAFQERPAIDTNGDGKVSPAENAAYAATTCTHLAGVLDLTLDGRHPAWQVSAEALSFPPGQGGLDTQRLECTFDAPVNLSAGPHHLTLSDRSYPDRVGWREMTAEGLGAKLQTDLPATSVTARLTDYSRNQAGGVLHVDRADVPFTVTNADATLFARPGAERTTHVTDRRARDPLTSLIARADQGTIAALAALAVAAALGALHGLAPGHGKTVVAAYLVGTRGSRRQALALALAVALSHTLGVFVLGGVTLAASTAFPLERVYGWLQLASALLIIGLGIWLAARLVASRRRTRPTPPTQARTHNQHSHPHGPDSHHHHDHRDPTDHHEEHWHEEHWHEEHRSQETRPNEHRAYEYELDPPLPVPATTSIPAGIQANAPPDLGRPEAITPLAQRHRPAPPLDHPAHHDHNPHPDHDRGHQHNHGHPHTHPGEHTHANDHDHPGEHAHSHATQGGMHRHGLLPHRHRVDWDRVDPNQALGWRALTVLGLSGGMVPSASAVIVLLGAVQLRRVPFGAALIVAFGVGLSCALVGVGLGVVAVTRRTRRYLDTRALAQRLTALVAPLAAGTLLVVGAYLALRALGRIN